MAQTLDAPLQGFVDFDHDKIEDVLCADYNKYGNKLVTGSTDHHLRVLYDHGQGELTLVDTWRGHNGPVLDVKWNHGISGEIIASIGEDNKLKIWQEDVAEDENTGRRWKCAYSQSCAHAVPYNSIDFVAVRHETYLAAVTRDGLLSLLEPAVPLDFSDWKELDQFWVCGQPVERGAEVHFRVHFQHDDAPHHAAVAAGLSELALSLAVSAVNDVKIYRVLPAGYAGAGPYRFQSPAAVLTGSRALVRDVAWSHVTYQSADKLAAASADGFVRVYEITYPEPAGAANPPAGGAASELGPSRAFARPQSGIGAGLAGASRSAAEPGSLEPGQVVHEWKCVAELRHEGVWKVTWDAPGRQIISVGDSGIGRTWQMGVDGKWMEFAQFDAEKDESEEEGEEDDS